MKRTTINIQNEANINAEGTHIHHSSKPIICIETGEVFASVTDAAEKAGVHISTISGHLTGKSRTVKGKHYCYMSRSVESLDAIVTRLRETSAMEDDARKWREYQAEQDRIRKAKEEHEAKIEKARNKMMKCATICDNLEQKLKEAIQNRIAAEKEFEYLIGPQQQEEGVA